jgi:NAD-dependent DNA ligase
MSLEQYDKEYHTLGTPSVSDGFYDLVKKEQAKQSQTSVGSKPVKDKKALPVFLGSLNKIGRDNSLSTFQEKYSGPYVTSDKIDGLSALLHFDGKNPPTLFSRGDGNIGQDITSTLHYIKNIPDEFKNPKPNSSPFSVRGELVLFKKDEEKGSRRNVMAGLVITAKTPDVNKLSLIYMIPYTVFIPDSMKPSDQLKWLKKHNWDPVWNSKATNLDYESLSDLLVERRETALYDIDGIVVFQDKVHDLPKETVSYAFAFKDVTKDTSAEVLVKNVTWKLSKNGAMKPTVEFDDPPTLNGALISKASGHNAAYIKDNKIGKGAKVKVVRSGGVIPYITEIIDPSTHIYLPPNTVWKSKDLVVEMSNEDCKLPQLENFFNVFKIKGLSSAGLKSLYDNGFIHPLDVLIRCTEKDIQHAIGNANGSKIYNLLQEKKDNKELDFFTFVVAHGIIQGGFGAKKLETLREKRPEIFEYNALDIPVTEEELISLPGVSGKTAEKLKQGLEDLNEFKKSNASDLEKLFK